MARADEGPGEAQVRRRAGRARAYGSGAHAPAASRTISEPLLRDAATVAAASFTPEQVAAATAQLEAARDKLAADGALDLGKIRRRSPMGRLVEPVELAEAAWFLASPAASAITGITLSVDCGWAAFGAAGDASAG